MEPDPLEMLVLDITMDWKALEELERLLAVCEPWPWEVQEADDELMITTAAGDPIASVISDEYGRNHAKLLAAAPLLAQRIISAVRHPEEGS